MSQVLDKINEELDKIRPFLKAHGGGVEVSDFAIKTGVLKLKFQGACVGCPLSELTFQSLINRQLDDIPEIKKVELIYDA